MNNSLLQEAHAASGDQTVAKAFADFTVPEGVTMARLIGYIEMGMRDSVYQGKVLGSALKAKLIFELLGKNYMHTDEDTKETHGTLHYEDVMVKTGEKASFRKLFMKMRNGRENIKVMSHMLGESFIIKIVHQKDAKDENKVWANIRKDGEWLVFPPIKEDPLDGSVTQLNAPEPTYPFRLLVWDNPTSNQWDSLFIDGERTVQDKDGVARTISRNYLQESIVKEAKDFEGSALETLLVSKGADLTSLRDAMTASVDAADEPVIEDEAPAAKAAPEEAPAAKAAPEEAPAEPAKQAAPEDVDAALAQLGFK